MLRFSSLLFVALALVPAGAHLMELAHKIAMPGAEYLTVQKIYRGWNMAAIVVIGALLSTLGLTLTLRGQAPAFGWALLAFACIVGTQVVFWSFTYPVNQATSNWTLLPTHWEDLRARWEYSHAASALLNVVALASNIIAVLSADKP
jgi:uncharacterized membrane-anchored protein